MRRTEPVLIGDVVNDFFRNNACLSQMLDEARAVDMWAEVAGPDAARSTTRINVARGRMYVHISSSVVRHEVFMNRTAILREINDSLGREAIKSLIIK